MVLTSSLPAIYRSGTMFSSDTAVSPVIVRRGTISSAQQWFRRSKLGSLCALTQLTFLVILRSCHSRISSSILQRQGVSPFRIGRLRHLPPMSSVEARPTCWRTRISRDPFTASRFHLLMFPTMICGGLLFRETPHGMQTDWLPTLRDPLSGSQRRVCLLPQLCCCFCHGIAFGLGCL